MTKLLDSVPGVRRDRADTALVLQDGREQRPRPEGASHYQLLTRNGASREHVHRYSSEEPLAPGSIIVLSDRFWLVDTVEDGRATAAPARYRLTLRHPDGRAEIGAFRRFRSDAPVLGHQLATFEDGSTITWTVIEQSLARDDSGRPFLQAIAERDYGEADSLPNHQLEHTLERASDDAASAVAMLAQARDAGNAAELVGLEPGEAPDWPEATRFLDSLILQEINDNLLVLCGVDPRTDSADDWLRIVKSRLRADLDRFRTDIEGLHDEVEEWDFAGGRVFAAVGSFDDDSNPDSGYGWICRLVDASVLQAAGFQRVREATLLP